MNILQDKSKTKALISSATAIAIDMMVYKSRNPKNIAILALTVGASSYVSNKLTTSLPDISNSLLKNSDNLDVKTLESRILELTLSTSGSFIINRYILNNMRELPLSQYLFIFGSCSVGSEYLTDYLFSEKLAYLT